MIVDLPRFVRTEREFWAELESVLKKIDVEPSYRMTPAEVQRFHYLYERSSADLARLDTFSTEPQLRQYLESLVARAYSEIHETRARSAKLRWRAAIAAFPQAFRRHIAAFQLSVAITILGAAFGWFALNHDPHAKAVIMPFPHLIGSPAERVAQEEKAVNDRLRNRKARFSADLMTHNIRVTILTFAMGLSWGIGTLILLFYNGVILGAVCTDYITAHQTMFLVGWLLPHGAVEIPSILFGGQAGFILASALIGWGDHRARSDRFREVSHDLFTIAAGAAVLLVWAGIVESFISQYHQPVLPYGVKIAFGIVELIALTLYLSRVGRK